MTIEIKSIHYADAAMPTTMDSFDWVGAHENCNIPANCHYRDIKIAGQIVIGVMPSAAQHLQQLLAAFCWTQVLSPPSIASWK